MLAPEWRVRRIDGVTVVGVGPHAAGEPAPPGSSLASLCAGSRGVIVDLTGRGPLSSEVLGHMMRAFQAATANGLRLRVCCPSDLIFEELRVVGLRALPIYRTLADTVAAFDNLTT